MGALQATDSKTWNYLWGRSRTLGNGDLTIPENFFVKLVSLLNVYTVSRPSASQNYNVSANGRKIIECWHMLTISCGLWQVCKWMGIILSKGGYLKKWEKIKDNFGKTIFLPVASMKVGWDFHNWKNWEV